MNAPQIFVQDVTLRDGMHAVRHRIGLDDVRRIVAALDPELLYRFSRALDRNPPRVQAAGDKAPSLLAIFRQFRGEDTRRGLAYGLEVLGALGAATREG